MYQMVIVGAGPAGLLTAYEAGQLGAKVALIERNLFGGNCLNTGCVPTKTLIRTSRLYADMRNADHYGAQPPSDVVVDFPAAMQRVRQIRARIAREASVKDLTAVGVDVFVGEGRFAGRDVVAVGDDVLRFEKA
jgi:pyruvate/2-oxoglutarate dehydrogenase complex dihydrolipoamide dehydrogenase (E3) component